MTLKFAWAPPGRLMFAGVVLYLAGCGSPRPAQRAPAVPGLASAAAEGLDLSGRPVNPFKESRAKAVTLLFVRTDCPISNHYAPEIQRLYRKFRAEGVAFWLVYPDDTTTAAEIEAHNKEYRLELPVLRDPELRLVQRAGARVTPEAAVFLPGGKQIYRGRIDDQFAGLGRQRSVATTHDLDAALADVVAGRSVTNAETVAFGCYISGL